jgi:hypothetical protein
MVARRTSVVLAFGALVAACHHPAAIAPAPIPLPGAWQHCWWTAMRATLPVDSVASAFRRAFVTVGQSGVHWTRSADTIFVRAGPAPLLPLDVSFDTASYGATYWARAVAFKQGDSTHFRVYVAIVTPAKGWAHPTDSLHTQRLLPTCQVIANAVHFRWIRRAGDPGDEEKLPVWSRVP